MTDIEAMGQQAIFFNTNAADSGKRGKVLDQIQAKLAADGGHQHIHVMMHSLAFGTLLPFIADSPDEAISEAQMDMTLNVMAHSLVYWVQDLMRRGLFTSGSRVFSMTSSGSHRVFKSYGAVSAAKASLESHTRQLALELGPARRDGQLHRGRRHRYARAAQDSGPRGVHRDGDPLQPHRAHDHRAGRGCHDCGAV